MSEDEKNKLIRELLYGKLIDFVGTDKFFELYNEAKEEIKKIHK